jgi:hypothetical protein
VREGGTVTGSLDEEKVLKFLMENPKYIEILKRAVEHEEAHSKDPYYLGWEWSDVRAYPAEIMRLIREGIVTIRYKSRRYTNYLLTDREVVKRCLAKLGVRL